MNLPFMQKFPDKMPGILAGKHTNFMLKIWNSLPEEQRQECYQEYLNKYHERFGPLDNYLVSNSMKPKLHTIRPGERFKPGDKIHFCINNRSKNYFRFAPVVQVVSVQEISITYFPRNGVEVSIDDVYQYYADRLELAINDGFNSLAEFEHYFLHSMGKECVFIGQLIHWTDLKY